MLYAEAQKKKMKNKKEVLEFQIQDMLTIGLTLVVTGIGIAYGLQVMGEVQDDMTGNSTEYNATGNAIEGVAKLPEKMPTIATVLVASIIIGILVTYLWARFSR